MNNIIAQLERSIIDHYFSRSENKSLTELLQKISFNDQQVRSLKKKIYSIAKSNIQPENFEAVLKWLEEVNYTIDKNNTTTAEAHFSPGNNCREAIISQLFTATNEIKICVFTISDNEIAKAIMKCQQKGITIKIITDNDKMYDRGSDIEQMAKFGVPIKIDNTSNHMHHKFMVIDKSSLITGSYNWTRSAAERNHENIVLLKNTPLIKAYFDEFNKLWEEMTFI